jgi:amidohydrolase
VAVRADMDALPVNETADIPYKSQNPGVKHACGHDAHITIELGVAEILSRMRGEIRGTVKFIFQPAEEGPPAGEEGGAPLMIKEGALENPRPAAIFGLHVLPDFQAGEIAWNSGAAMASSDTFNIVLRGQGSHGARPHLGVDTVVVAAEAIMALQTIRSRRIDTQEPLVLTFGKINGGTRFNILADEVVIEGTFRAHSEEVRARIKELMRQTLNGVTSTYGASYRLNFTASNFVTYNDPQLVADTLPTLRRVIGEKNLYNPRPQMVSEDFSAFQQVVPGFFFFLGVSNKQKGIGGALHTAEFELDEDALVVGVKAMSNILLDYLDKNAR